MLYQKTFLLEAVANKNIAEFNREPPATPYFLRVLEIVRAEDARHWRRVQIGMGIVGGAGAVGGVCYYLFTSGAFR